MGNACTKVSNPKTESDAVGLEPVGPVETAIDTKLAEEVEAITLESQEVPAKKENLPPAAKGTEDYAALAADSPKTYEVEDDGVEDEDEDDEEEVVLEKVEEKGAGPIHLEELRNLRESVIGNKKYYTNQDDIVDGTLHILCLQCKEYKPASKKVFCMLGRHRKLTCDDCEVHVLGKQLCTRCYVFKAESEFDLDPRTHKFCNRCWEKHCIHVQQEFDRNNTTSGGGIGVEFGVNAVVRADV